MLNPYHLNEIDEFSFSFVTDFNVGYNATFVLYPTLFQHSPLVANNIYIFNLDVEDGDENVAKIDDRIGSTIAVIFNKFFTEIENAVIYVCDSSDNRQLARKRKFDYWFWKYNNSQILKEDGQAIVDGKEIINTVILHKQNPSLREILISFAELNESIGDKD